MENRQENKLSMYLTVQGVINFHSDVWKDFLPFKDQFYAFEAFIDLIKEIRPIQEGKITGITKDKSDARNKLTQKAVFIAEKAKVYASITGKNKLLDRVSYKLGDFEKARDTVVIDIIQVIYAAASQHIADLGIYEIGQEYLDELKSLTDIYADIVEDPRQAITNRIRATKAIKQYIAEADSILKDRLDILVNHFKETSPVFWQQYKSARLIINLGRRKRKGLPVENSEIPVVV